ncbi:uncharacterized protein [Miscanthus floridulus]|uniref:uncharacterized protein n=1 Tax=Miscanthus floridulus TaxID=154761 RepID=UPI00345A4FA8
MPATQASPGPHAQVGPAPHYIIASLGVAARKKKRSGDACEELGRSPCGGAAAASTSAAPAPPAVCGPDCGLCRLRRHCDLRPPHGSPAPPRNCAAPWGTGNSALPTPAISLAGYRSAARRGPGAAPSRRCPATAPARFRPSRSRRFALASPASSLAQHLARAYSSLGRQLWSANVPCRPPHQQRMTHQASDYFSAHGQTSRSQFQPRFNKPNREALRRRSMMLPSDVRASANATFPHASPPLGPSIASTTSRKRRADNILCSDALHSATVSTDHRVVSVSSSSRSTRHWSSLAQTNATTNPALQCFGRHKLLVYCVTTHM